MENMLDAVHENLYALFRAIGRLPGSQLYEDDALSIHNCGLPNPMFRGVWNVRTTAESADAVIDQAVDWFDEQAAPDFMWWTDHRTEPSDLAERLQQRGFDGNPTGDPAMALDLSELDPDMTSLPDFTIVRVTDDAELTVWRDVFVAAFGMPPAGGDAWVNATVMAGRERAPWALYLGYAGATPVATSMIFPGAGVAGVYAIGTIPSARRNGYGAAVTVHGLREARDAGLSHAVLFTSRIARSVYRRIGFRDLGQRIGVYIYEPD